MTGFQHDIAGGQGNLIATSMQSPNFVSGSAGWQVRKDGSVEFNNGTFRGTVTASTFQGTDFLINSAGAFWYSGAPALGNLIISLANASGTDSHGNTYPQGLGVAAGAIPGGIINAGSVGTAQITAAAITNALLAAAAVGTSNVQSNAITNALIADYTIDSVVAGAAFHGLNMITDAQFAVAGINTARLADTAVMGSWAISGGAVTGTLGGGTIRFPLAPSTLRPFSVTPGETYFLSVGVTTSTSVTVGMELAYGNVSPTGVQQVVNGTATVSGVVTVPANASHAYIRVFAFAGSGTAAFSNPLLQPATLNAPSITGGTITGGTITGATFDGTDFIINSSGAFFYSSTPAAGDLIMTINGNTSNTTDSFGNAVLPGTTVYSTTLGFFATQLFGTNITLLNATSQAGPYSQLAAVQLDSATGITVSDLSGNGITLSTNGGPIVIAPGGATVTSIDGQLTAIDGSIGSPTLIQTDTWHTISLDAGWTAGSPAPSYRLLPDGNLQLTGMATHAGITTETALNSGTPIPAAYRPLTNKNYQANRAGGTAGAQVKTTGVVFAEPNGVSNTSVDITGVVPLNL